MKLYELKQGDKFKLLEEAYIPPDAKEGNAEGVYKLKNIDGMYSFCWGPDKEIYHFAAWTEVEQVKESTVCLNT